MFPVSVIALNATIVVYGILFGGMHPIVFISMMSMQIEMFPVSVIAPNATMVVYGIIFGVIHPTFKHLLKTVLKIKSLFVLSFFLMLFRVYTKGPPRRAGKTDGGYLQTDQPEHSNRRWNDLHCQCR